MKSIIANALGWQLECLKLAKAGEEFAVEGFSDKNLLFFNELCTAYQYEMALHSGQLVFNPSTGCQ